MIKQTSLRIWDQPDSMDRYTILPPASDKSGEGLGCGLDPQGMSYVVEGVKAGRHLGKRVPWGDLPPAVQRRCQSVWPQYVFVSVLTKEQEQALDNFRRRAGRCWKEDLRVAWYTGKDANLPDGGLLRQIRNTFGPLWLNTYGRVTKPQ